MAVNTVYVSTITGINDMIIPRIIAHAQNTH